MDPIMLIVTALAAGAASALQDDAKGSVKAAFGRLRQLVKRRFKDPAHAEYLLEKHVSAPETWQAPLTRELSESDAASDPELVSAAQELMALLDTAGSRAGKYVVSVSGSQGVQVGDHNVQHNNVNFGSRSVKR
jgi:hypothetical protein